MNAVEVVGYIAFAAGAVTGALVVGVAFWVNRGHAILEARRRVPASRKGVAM